ncbi:two-component regulator propeller domain-containing protein [Candidatus Latescibacterota bacterium]
MKKINIPVVWLIILIFGTGIFFGCGSSTLDDENGVTSPESEFTIFTNETGLADNWITDIVVDSIHRGVWCATLNGISFYSCDDSTWTTYGAESDIPDMKVKSLALDYFTGSVLAGTESGSAVFNDSLWTAFADMDSLVHRNITTVVIMNDGSLWFGTRGGVSILSYNGWSSYTAYSGLSGDDVTSIAASATGDIWVGTTNGISVFDGKGWTSYGLPELPSTYVRSLYKDNSGRMWCGTNTIAVSFDGERWVKYGQADGLAAQGINDFVQDKFGKIWAVTDGGVFYFPGDKWHELDIPEKVDGEIMTTIAEDVSSGVLWIGTSNGLVKYKQGLN